MISHKRYRDFRADTERGRMLIKTIWRSADGTPFAGTISIPLKPSRLEELARAEEIGVLFWRKKPIYVYGKGQNH